MPTISITHYLDNLKKSPLFQGDIGHETDAIVQAVDNSIYELRPQAVIYPKSSQDIQTLLTLSAHPDFNKLNLHFTPRGGGTGTNGQSLSDGIIIDVSKHMDQIIHFDESNKEIKVQPGVTLEQLNAYLKPLGYFFPPNVSSGSRATIGGMLSTDASGMGSRLYGKTSDWISEIDAVLSNSLSHTFKEISLDEIENETQNKHTIAPIYQQIKDSVTQHRQLIEEIFPKMNRGLTGYNLKNTLQYLDNKDAQKATHLNPCYLIAGSEGTLCIITQIKCRIQPIPKHKAVAAVLYHTLPQAIEAVPYLIKANPSAIEFINDQILKIAQQDECWQSIAPLIQQGIQDHASNSPLGGINFIQLIADDEQEMQANITRLENCLQSNQNTPHAASGWHIAHSPQAVNNVWEFRQKAQGLISSPKGKKRSIAFIEDAAVPVEKLPIFIDKLNHLFKQYNIQANIYGHADVGCVHVRPNLDLTNSKQKNMIRKLSDEVFHLTKELGGLIWGEHGKGIRGEYNPQVFGRTLYTELQKIKTAFDPDNKLNPGKVATPLSTKNTPQLLKLDEVTMRAETDSQILPKYGQDYAQAIYCNGNGACFSWDVNEPLCPSYKVTRDRRHSPKGRAMLLREWLKLSLDNQQEKISQDILPIMNNCFGCGACTHHCPLHVNIPDLRAKFLSTHYQSHSRPIKDYLIASIESLAPIIGNRTWLLLLINTLQNNFLSKKIIARTLGMIDLPQYSLPTFKQQLKKQTPLTQKPVGKKIVLIVDCFNLYYDAPIITATLLFLQKIGIHATLAPYFPSGKAQHIKGFLPQYQKTALHALQQLKTLNKKETTFVGIDSSVSLIYQTEYPKIFGQESTPKVHLLHEWLHQHLKDNPLQEKKRFTHTTPTSYQLLLHCSENTAAPQTGAQWQHIFSQFNLELTAKKLGCCGMAGSFGHELSNLSASKRAYQLSWQKVIQEYHINRQEMKSQPSNTLLTTGYSCRSQVKRFSQIRLPHPIEILAKMS